MTTGWADFDRLLNTDPRDSGCARAIDLLHVYADLMAADPDAAAVHLPDVAAHLDSCGPCQQDLDGLLAAITAS